MKRLVRISGIMLALMIAGTAAMTAQRGNRGMMQPGQMMGPGMGPMQGMRMQGRPDSLRMERMKKIMDSAQFRGQMRGRGPAQMQAPGGFQGWNQPMGRGFGIMPGRQGWYGNPMPPQGPGRGGRQFGPGFGPGFGPAFGPGMRPFRPDSLMRQRMGDRLLGNIPNLTDKQKAEIGKLRKDQQAEMQKVREEFAAKIKTLREEQRTKVMSLLTDEQKKSLGYDASRQAAPAEKQTTPATKGKSK